MQLGSMAQLGAGIGRSMSPVAGAGIIIAGLAGINPMEMAKRNAVPCIIATVVICYCYYSFIWGGLVKA